MGHRGDDANEILAVTDGVVDAVRDAGRYASVAFARARVMLAKRGIRRLEAEGESV
jgi:sulfite reductase beta subunit-like hemoprotein